MSKPQLATLKNARSRLEDARFAFLHGHHEMAMSRLCPFAAASARLCGIRFEDPLDHLRKEGDR